MELFFDLDGTIIDSAPGIKMAFEHSFEEVYGESISFNTEHIGPSIGVLHDYYFQNTGINRKEEFVSTFRKSYDNEFCLHSVLYPNVVETFEYIISIGHSLSIFTNKPLKPTSLIVDLLNLGSYFKHISTIDEKGLMRSKGARVKEYLSNTGIAPESVFFVGDTVEDYDVSMDCALSFIFASYGYGTLNENSNYHTIENFSDLKLIFLVA